MIYEVLIVRHQEAREAVAIRSVVKSSWLTGDEKKATGAEAPVA